MSDLILRTLWVYGLAVIVSLGVAVVIKIIVLTIGRLERQPAAAPQPVAMVAAPLAIEAHHVAAIAAAVHVMGGTHRIVHIEAAHRHQEWAAGGRQAQHASHAPSHHPRH